MKCKCGTIFKPFKRNGINISKFCSTCFKKKEQEKRKKAREKLRKIKKREKKANSKSVLVKQLDIHFSIFIRRRDKGKCISCGVQREVKKMQNGHYIRRSVMNTRWDEKNCHCQCPRCNIFMSGNYPAYTIGLIEKHGEEIIKELNDKSNKTKKWTVEELKNLIKFYEN